ncbi:MAG: type II secretion system major pseudopilin GspG [Phycisphaerales bacterium]|nr:type II secretion system major pseudopilin GspG [Phycisphaerales bacterium]
MDTEGTKGAGIVGLGGRGLMRSARRAFSLLEVMIVIGIILVLSGLIGVTLFARRDEAKQQIVQTKMNNIRQALKLFRLDFERYPTEEEGLAVLWNKELLDPEADTTKWKGYMESPVAKDDWGSEWGYEVEQEPGEEPIVRLWSFGPDKQDGTEDDLKATALGSTGEEDEEGLGDSLLPPEPSGSGG